MLLLRISVFMVFVSFVTRAHAQGQPAILDPWVPSGPHFPFVSSAEDGLPRHIRFRAEGLPLAESAQWTLSYVRKWFQKKFSAPPEEIAYFDDQRALARFLRGRAPAGEVAGAAVVKLGYVGDIMWVRSQWNRFLDPSVLEYLEGFDAVVGNLESPISRSMSVPYLVPDTRYYNSHPDLVRSFRDRDGRPVFGALATANNHALDMGDQGAVETLEFLDEEGIPHSGIHRTREEPPFVTFERNGVKFGFHATTWGLNDPRSLETTTLKVNVLPGLAPEGQVPADLTEIRSVLAKMQEEGCDFRIVMVHWGFEFEYYPTPFTMQVGREIVAAGADLVVGAHPHEHQPSEIALLNGYESRYASEPGAAGLRALLPGSGCVLQSPDGQPRKALIAYSMGNFATTMYSTLSLVGRVDGISVTKDTTTGAVDWDLGETRLVYNRIPKVLPGAPRRQLILVDPAKPPFHELRRRYLGPGRQDNVLQFLARHLGISAAP